MPQPPPLREVQLLLNSEDLEHEVDWLPDWLAERGLAGEPSAAPERCARRCARSCARTTASPLDDEALATVNAAARRVSLQVDADRRLTVATDGDALDRVVAIALGAMLDGSWGRLKACRNCRWSFYDKSPNRSGDMVLDAALRQPQEDARVPEAEKRREVASSRCVSTAPSSPASRSRSLRASTSRTSARSRTRRRGSTASASASSASSRQRSSSSHAAMQVPMGRLCDRLGARLVGAAGLVVVAVASAAALGWREAWFAIAMRLRRRVRHRGVVRRR